MNQTAINLIAITVFSLTISSLLGPLFNLPPAVPAVLAFCILGLATIDSFNWRGQLGTLIIEKISAISPEHRQRIIHHEAGHFLVAHLLEIPVAGYALSAWEAFQQGQSAQGGVRFDDQKLNAELEQGQISALILERYSKVWMAGIAAEQFVYGNAQGGAEDRQKVRAIYTQIGMASQAQIKERGSALQALNLIQTHQEAYQALVEAMTKKLSVEECCRLIDERRS
ncbi:ATP-dependent Zn protease [Ancylothrix sp. C2]|uniref:ATP-dependent Zn protease n=1 Tax=Ancylothrix sp. D3o TaxID=2953691 RepID=UPI0021BB2E63|nr:ATP-dependent Zn protease [Ancylothrix sp. D3o]MCT7951549.1 ATP-dependent Zn protease [Ancylothrix sp. D3o]